MLREQACGLASAQAAERTQQHGEQEKRQYPFGMFEMRFQADTQETLAVSSNTASALALIVVFTKL